VVVVGVDGGADFGVRRVFYFFFFLFFVVLVLLGRGD
jgi:hypothetical protein